MKFKKITVLLLAFTMLFPTACAQTSHQTSLQASAKNPEKKRKVIIDTDTGADDSAALILAARADNLDILGVTNAGGECGA